MSKAIVLLEGLAKLSLPQNQSNNGLLYHSPFYLKTIVCVFHSLADFIVIPLLKSQLLSKSKLYRKMRHSRPTSHRTVNILLHQSNIAYTSQQFIFWTTQ